GAGIPGALGMGVVGAALILNLAYLVRENWTAVDFSTSDNAQARWQDVFAQPLEANAVIVGNWESLTPLEYYQYVQGERRDLQKVKLIAYTSQLAQAGNAQKTALARLDAEIRRGRPVYLTLNPAETETLGGWARGYDLMPSGSLWQIFPKAPNAPPMQNVLACAQFGDAISLRGYALDGTRVRAGESVRITLYWTARATLRENYTVFVHLLDANNHVRGQHDSAPRNNQLATTDWIPGVSISDQHQLDLPADAPAGTYQIEIGLYRAEDGKRLAVDECQNALPGDHLILNQTLAVTR
ncbi:MAG TPA: hypothetical protein VIX58_00940, partial [Anaerolineae bacterium]